jgi:hypothetical protein
MLVDFSLDAHTTYPRKYTGSLGDARRVISQTKPLPFSLGCGQLREFEIEK